MLKPDEVNTVSRVFQYDRIFGEAPSNLSDLAWQALFPEQGGFFKHPDIAPERSAFAVFHQLHCLVRNTRKSICCKVVLTICVEWHPRRLLGCARCRRQRQEIQR